MANSHGGSKCNSDTPNAHNAYEAKFQDMQKYIPFLEKMIQRLQRSKGGTRENQLAKMKSLYTILSDGKHRYGLTLESLEKCDSILRNLYQKVKGEDEDLMLQSLSPKNSDGKPVLPPTNATKAKENEPNPSWVLGSPQKPAPGFKKNFKKQKLAMVPGHAGLHQSTASHSKASATKTKDDQPNKHKVTKLCSKVCDLKAGKIKTNVKLGSKVSSSPEKEHLSSCNHSKSVVQPKKPIIDADQKKSIGNSARNSTIVSNEDKPVVSSPLSPHSSMNLDKKKETVCTTAVHHSVKNSKEVGNTAAVLHDSKKKEVNSSKLKQHSTSNMKENKNTIPSQIAPTSISNVSQAVPISGSSITQHSAPKCDLDKEKLITAKKSDKDERNAVSAPIRQPHNISSDKCLHKRNLPSGSDNRLHSSQPLSSQKRVESEGSTNVSDHKKSLFSSFAFKASETNTKPSSLKNTSDAIKKTSTLTSVSETNIKPSSSSEAIIKPSSTFLKVSETITKSTSTFTSASETIKKQSSTFVNTSETITKPSSVSEAITKPPSKYLKSSETIEKPSSTFVNSGETITKPPTTFENASEPIAKPPSTFVNASEPIAKPPSKFVKVILASPTKSNEPSMQNSTPTTLNESKFGTKDNMPNSPSTIPDQHTLKRPSPKDPRLARGLLTKSLLGERWKQPSNQLQECKVEHKQENVSCKTETRQQNATGKSEPSQSQSLRAKLAEQITTVHKVGTSVGGALRSLTKNLPSIEQNRIANLKPGTIIDLMDKELPKTNKKTKQDKVTTQISDQQTSKTNKSTISNLTQDELEKLVVKNIHNLPALPPDTKQILEMISTNMSQGSPTNHPASVCNRPVSDEAMSRLDPCEASTSNQLHNDSRGSLITPAMSEENSKRFDSSQNIGSGEFCRVEGKSSILNSDQTSNQFDSTQTPRSPDELYDRGLTSASKSISDQATNRFDSFQYSRTNEFYNRAEESTRNPVISASSRFDQIHICRTNELYSRLGSPAATYSNWENPALDSVGMPSPFRIQSPIYTQTNLAQDTSCRNNVYHRYSGPSSPSYGVRSENDNLPLYGTNYMRDPRRRSVEQADCRSPESDDWQRVVIHEDRSQFTPDYSTNSDSVWSDDNSRFPSRYHQQNTAQNSSQYGRSHMTSRSNSTPSSRRFADHRLSPERTPERFSNSRSSLDYPEERRYSDSRLLSCEERRYSDSRQLSERRVSEARLKKYRDEPFPDSEHGRVRPTFRSSYDRSYNTSSADRYHSYSGRSGESQERTYSDSRSLSRNRDSDSYRSNRRESFTSPLDKLYSETRGPVTGRGYGVQNFRLPKSKPKESDLTSNRKSFDKNASQSEDASKSTELEVQAVANEIKKEDDSNEKFTSSNVSTLDESISKEVSHSKGESPLSEEEEKANEQITNKPLGFNMSDTDKILITASNFVEERKVVILLEKSDMESSKEKEISSSGELFDSKKSEVHESEVKSTPEIKEKQSVNENSDSISTTPQILVDALHEEPVVKCMSSENPSLTNKIDAASNVDGENHLQMSADLDNISMSSKNKSEIESNEKSEISREQTEIEDGNKKMDNDENDIAKPGSDDQKSKDKHPTVNSSGKDDINSDKSLQSTIQEKSNDDSIHVDLSDESEIPIEKESNDIQHCKIEEPIIKEENESSSSNVQSNEPTTDIDDEKSKLIHKIVEAFNKNKQQAGESKPDFAKIGKKINTEEKMRLLQQILELSDDENDTDEKNVPSEDIKPDISLDKSLQDEVYTVMTKDELSETSSIKSNDTSYNDDSNDLKLIETDEKSKQIECDTNRKKGTPPKRTIRGRSRRKTENTCNVETSHGVEISLNKSDDGKKKDKGNRKTKNELDRLHDGLREMFLKAEIEKTSGIRSCRLRNVNDSPETTNRKKVQKEKPNTMDNSEKYSEESEEIKDCSEHDNDKVKGNSQVELKDSSEDAGKDSEETSPKSSSCSKKEKIDVDSVSKVPEAITSTSDQKNQLPNNDNEHKSDIKSIMSSGSLRSTPIVLLQKSNVLMSIKPVPSKNSSTPNPVPESFETQSENIDSDKVVQQTDPTVQPVQCKEVDDCHTSEETVQTNDKSAPKKPRKYLRKKHLPENLDKNKSVSVEKIERNPVILLEKRNLNESACQTNFETDVLPNENDSAPHTATAPDSDYNKNDTSMKISSSHTGTGKITSQRRPTFEYSELPNIFTDKSYHQKTTAHKPNCQLECKICHFFGKSIVKHYVTEHSDQDVLISRLEANDARDAIMKSNSEEISMKPSWFQCYMCSRLCTNLSSFYDHITSHTGEYRFRCQLCPFKVANRHAMKVHCTSTHSLDWRTSHRTAVVVGPIPDMKTVFGFICSDCYFVQLNKSTVEEHVKNHHSDASDVEIIRINMSSLEAQAANSSAGSNQRSNERQSIPSTGETHDDVSNDNSVQTVINVCAFSCTEPMNDLREKQSIMEEAFENIEETIFITERTVDEKISDKIGALSNYWQSLSGNDESLPQVDNDFQNETKTNIESDKVSETEVLENLVPVAEKEVEVMDFEVDQLDQVDETTILEEIRLVTSDSEDDTADNNRFGVCADDRINSLLDKFQKEHKNNEENGKRDGDDRDDFENDEVRDGDDLLNLISNVSGDSAGIKKVDIGPLTISRYNERVRFSCNIRSCQFRSDNPKYIVCHFGNHLTPSAKLHCNWCNEEFDCSMDAVGLMKGLVKHGLDHVLPSPQPPTPPQVAGKLGQPPGFLRVRRLSGDQLSIYSSEGESGSAGPSSAQQSTSSSSANDSLGHLRIESVFSAANCDAATLHELNSLHEPDTKFPNKPRNDAPTKPTFKFLVHFYKCMGTDCKFSTNNCLLYKEHLKSHTRRHRKRTITYSWFICSYCSREENCMSALVKHIHLYHSNSYYQCAHCTYRSASKSNVIFHQQMKHVDEQIKIYLCEKRPPSLQSLSSLKYSEIITAYQCLINDCMVRSFVWDAILKHIDLHHLAVLQCFMCKVVFTKENPLMLIQHFLLHGIGLYQCTYCRHGVNTTEEMRNHLCDKHPDQPPRVMMREVKTGATPLFLRGSDIDSNLRQLTGIILDDLEEPEGSVIDCTKFTDEPPKTQNVGPKMWVVDFENGKELLMDNSGTIFNVRPYQPRENVDMYARKDSEGFAGEWNAPSVLPATPHEQSNTENQQTQEFAAPTVVESHQMLVKRPPPPVLSLLDLFKEQQKSAGVQQELRTATESHRLPVNRPEPSVIPPHNLQQSEATQPQQTVSNVAEEPTSSQVAAQKMRLEISGEAPRIINDVSIEISSDSEGRVEISSDSEANNDNVNVIQGGMCFVCHRIFDDLQQACLHLTTEHRITKTKTVPFFCNVNNMAVQVVRSEIVVCDTPTKSSIDLKTKFTMNEVELLPKKAILSTPIHCDHCGFSNVVVKNMKIHLQSHASGKQVSNSLLVNPVPCLEKNEKMFDKMINLAGSSHSQPAKTFELPPELPKFVPENVRYLCCVCNYRAINDQMLVQHITALHHDTSQYKCPHCIDCSVTIDKIVFHLRMHDVRLYRCSYCIFFHYQRHQVSKHLNEKHFEKKQFVQIVRDPDPVDDGFKSTEESGDEYNSMPKSYKVWQCAFCDIFKIKEIFIRDHCQRAHGIEDRFKCCFCAFISYCEDTVRAHFKDRHSGNTLQIAEAYNRVCIFAPKNPSLDLRLYFHQRRERNLRNNIRGITFDEPSSSRRTMDHGIQAWTSFKCPECGLITKNKEELIKHLWTEYTIIQIELPPEKKKEIKQWIDMVIQYQEAKISEQPKINETGGSEPKRRNSSGEDSTSSRSKKQHSRKRALPRGDVITLSDSGDSDNSGDSKKQKRTRIEDSLYICGYCNYKDFLVGSQKHQEERHPNRPWKVQMISPDHQSNQNLAKPKTTVYECQICGKVDLRTALLEHFRLTHPSSHVKMSVLNCELFKCNHCGHVDDSLDRLSAHSSGAHPKMPFDVHAVTKQESSSDEVILIQDHSTSTDTDNMQYACSSCNAIFNAQHACILHIKKEHGSNASIKIVSKFGSDSSNSGSSPIPPRVAAPSTSGIHRRADLVKKPARKSPIAKKSTSKVRRVENNPDKDEDDVDKVYFSKVVLKDLRNVPQQ